MLIFGIVITLAVWAATIGWLLGDVLTKIDTRSGA